MRLAGGAAGGGQPERVSGVVPALVDDVNDPKDLCRVRVRFPWMDENYVSDWTRVVQPGAGKKRGLVVMPEVGDEVLAAFEQGDVRRPYVLGGLYNTEDTPEVGPGGLLDGSSKAVNNRLFTSRKGHQLVFIDADQDCGVLVSTADGKLSVRLDQAKSKVHIVSGGDVDVKADGNIKLEATGSLELKGQSVKIEAQSSFGAKGATVSVEASGPTQVKGKPLQLN
jgi:uncharacterized protein involved in type VI secretion and phage assembly